ncbi:hypothetical protein [Leucobacter chromiiresistens]|uniref:Uncharacterized protein n=1 Tax=Leucobacter chromiiresistens TaxID=1079994 RepID=A0A147EPB9_9MICO|nr:hypothetical protein [Leucobacter chromiiresistens]KTR86382.1 hypothetical protein NS354_05135 [Leucobacter chromiiresistens]
MHSGQIASSDASPYLISIGNIHATDHWVVTPAGSWPLDRANVAVQDQTTTTTHTPAWAIVMVILFIWFFLLSLLFLLARETRIHGHVAVTVYADGQSYVEHIPVYSVADRASVFHRVAHLQYLIGNARAVSR